MADWILDSSSSDVNKQIPYKETYPEMLGITGYPDSMWLIDSSSDDPNKQIPYKKSYPKMPAITGGPLGMWFMDSSSDDPNKQIPYKQSYPKMPPAPIKPEPPTVSWFHRLDELPKRPWCELKKAERTFVEEDNSIPAIDWTASMQQTYEYYIVDPSTWQDSEQITDVTSSSVTHDSTSRLGGSSNCQTTGRLEENYIRTYLVAKQNGITYKECLGTFLYMTTSDSFNGITHEYSAIGYAPLVELDENLPPMGYAMDGSYIAPDSTTQAISYNPAEAIMQIIRTYSRCQCAFNSDLLDTQTYIVKPVVLAPSDTWLDAITAMLKAVYNEQFTIGVNRDGSIYFRKYETIDEIAPVFVYTDDNASILLPTVNTSLDLYKIPNVIELIYSGEGGTYRSIAKNEDESSVVSINQRKREIRKRVILNRVPRTADSIDQAYFDNYARDLLEQVSTISQEISFSHGYCGTKVGDVVLINYTRAGLNNVKGRIISQTINCVPGCTVDETIVYTKKLWVNKNVVYEDDEPSEEDE